MRAVLSVSMPTATLRRLKKKAKDKEMTVSAYLVRLVDEDEHLISEEELLEDIRVSEKEIREEKGVILRSDDDIKKFFKRLR